MSTPLKTRVARAAHGDNRYFDAWVNADLLAGGATMTELAALAATGRRPTSEQTRVLDDLAVAVTVADPRIWPLKLTRVVGAYGSKYAAYAAGALGMDEALMSVEITSRTAARLEALAPVAARLDDDGLVEHLAEAWPERRPPGFGVPGRSADERVTGLVARMTACGRSERPYFALFSRVAELMRARRGLEVNLTLIFAAIALDLGFAPPQVGPLAWATSLNAFLANAVEGAAQAPDVLRQLPASMVRYEGRAPRTSPRAQSGSSAS